MKRPEERQYRYMAAPAEHQPAPAFIAWADRERRAGPALHGLRDALRGAGL